MDVHDDLVVFLHTETQRNKYLAVSITNETASLLLRAAISYSHADSVMIKLVTIQWTGIFTTTIYFTVHTFPAEGSGMLMPLMLVEFQGFHFNIELPISIKHDILFGNSCLWWCYGSVPPL
jgi:hypothetical protein